ncbi:MAG: P-loop containing nucleoside triphosphate hydrolase protein [Olpidium bornovanus]|uniref:Kinesin-like protein n=1 Tax=Olpidium bornovanus TaxID=278681 RepID=A0A8H7ZSF1_9FUNG|nr:MAG: P-loop containing nucleoside triphosphate hydrolase protein [Olpidium bornovanus]
MPGDEGDGQQPQLGGFRPPAALIQVKDKRQAELKEKQERRHEEAAAAAAAEPNQTGNVGRGSPASGRASPGSKNVAAAAFTAGQGATLSPMNQRRTGRPPPPGGGGGGQAEVMRAKQGLNDREQVQLLYARQIEEFRAKLLAKAKKLGDGGQPVPAPAGDRDVRIRVCVRQRPMSSEGAATLGESLESGRRGPDMLYVHELKVRLDLSHEIDTHAFRFDRVFGETANNEEIYQAVAKPLVKALFKGGRVTFFCYGQVPDRLGLSENLVGKTHTVFGEKGGKGKGVTGLYGKALHGRNRVGNADGGALTRGFCWGVRAELACRDIFELKQGAGLNVYACFFEIYGGRIYDLFSNRGRVTLLEDKTGRARVRGLREIRVDTVEDLLNLTMSGNLQRTTASIEANATSSRSHAVFQLALRHSEGGGGPGYGPLFGKFSLIDLAGSERGADTGNASRQARIEAADINVSLLALKECIRALHKKSTASEEASQNHVPFRASKLTQILRDSLIGKGARTVMIANISPVDSASEHTLNTLRYAARVKDFRDSQTVGAPVGAVARAGSKSRIPAAGSAFDELTAEVAEDEEEADEEEDVASEEVSLEPESDFTFEEVSSGFDTSLEEQYQPRSGPPEAEDYEFDAGPTPLPPDGVLSASTNGSDEDLCGFTWTTAASTTAISIARTAAAAAEEEEAAAMAADKRDLAELHTRLGSPACVKELHFAVDHLLAAEDALLRDHRAALAALSRMAAEVEAPLIEAAAKGQGEIDAYAAGLADVIDSKIAILFRLRRRVEEVSKRLSEEEAASVGAIENEEERLTRSAAVD